MTQQPNVFIPFTHLRSETYLASENAGCKTTLWPIKDHEYGYADYWVERWTKGERFINLEQDVVPSIDLLWELWTCPEPYCIAQYAYPWAGSPVDHSPIGCAKFAPEFIARFPQLFVRRLHWHEPQHLIIDRSLNKYHLHGPPALHLHVNDNWPNDARRKYDTPR